MRRLDFHRPCPDCRSPHSGPQHWTSEWRT